MRVFARRLWGLLFGGLSLLSTAESAVPDEWHAAICQFQQQPPQAQLQAVNQWVDVRVGYVLDTDSQWHTPFQTLETHTGDCKDYAFTKYALLLASGWPVDRLRLGYGRTAAFGAPQAHLVVLAFLEGDPDPLVLDNLGDAILRLSKRSDFELVFSFNEQDVYSGSEARPMHPKRPFPRWDDLRERMRESGALDMPAPAGVAPNCPKP